MKMTRRFIGLALATAMVFPVLAMATDAPHVQASMLVSGTISVDPHGVVTGYTVKDADKLPSAIRQLIKDTVPAWRFQPVMHDGVAVSAATGMSLQIVADFADPEHATIRVRGEHFGCAADMSAQQSSAICPAGAYPSYRAISPPRYPIAAERARIGGEVFLMLQVGADGQVLQSAVRQVDLYIEASDPASARSLLAHAALDAAKSWTFNVPTRGAAVKAGKWVVTVPVNFEMRLAGDPIYVRSKHSLWRTYIPGPVNPIPWVDDAAKASGTHGDAVAGNGPFLSDGRFVLRTPSTHAAPGA